MNMTVKEISFLLKQEAINEDMAKKNEILKQRGILLGAMHCLLELYKNCEVGSEAESLAKDGLESANWKGSN